MPSQALIDSTTLANKLSLLRYLQQPNCYPLVVTGAGISVASGIPTFRGSDPDAVWANDVLEMGTRAYFERNPVHQWLWYLSRFLACQDAEPNPAHHALKDIERTLADTERALTICTQNVDGLHLKAGSIDVIEIHGAARKMRCSNRNCENGAPKGFVEWDTAVFEAFLEDPKFETLPRCPACNKFWRAHVLWFDESYYDHMDYGLQKLESVKGSVNGVVFIGTSFSVGITDMISTLCLAFDIPTWVIDPHMTEAPYEEFHLIQDASETYLPRLAEELAR